MSGSLRWWAPWALPVSAPPARDVLVTVSDGRITGLESRVPRERAAALGDVQLHDGCVIAPGFVNAHAHLEYACYGALTDGHGFAGWIGDHIHRKRRLSPQQMRASADLGALTAMHAGITCIGDASFSGDAAHAMHEAGLRGRVYLEVFGGDDVAEQQVADCRERLAALPSSDLLQHGISPHAPYTASPRLYRSVAEAGLPWMTHLLESEDELAYVHGRGPLHAAVRERGICTPDWEGRSPVQELADLLGPHVVVVHHVKATPADWETLARRGAAVAHCPRSNARLGCGVMDLAAADRAGVVVGLGTDSPSSAGPLDPFDELRAALQLHRATAREPDWPDLPRLLRMATVDAARALGYGDLGTLDIGAHADLIAVHVGPCDDPLAAYLLGGRPDDVRAVAVAGRDARVRDRTRLEQARERAAEARQLLALPHRPTTAAAR